MYSVLIINLPLLLSCVFHLSKTPSVLPLLHLTRITIPTLSIITVEKKKVKKKYNQYNQSICPSFSPLSSVSHLQDNLDVTSAYLDLNKFPKTCSVLPLLCLTRKL